MKIANGDDSVMPEAGAHHDALADLALLHLVQRVPHRLRQRRAGVEEHLHARQQLAAQRVVGLHRVGDRLEAGRHVEVDGGRDLAQVVQRLAHQRGRGLAVVDVERAAVVDRQAEVVVAAERVVPGQPVDSTGGSSASTGMLWRICCWLAHHMRCVLITALGSLVEPEVKRNMVMVSGRWPHRRLDRGVGSVVASTQRTAWWRALDSAIGQHYFYVRRHVAAISPCRTCTVAREHQARHVNVCITWRSLS
jgi:hypothetical protein